MSRIRIFAWLLLTLAAFGPLPQKTVTIEADDFLRFSQAEIEAQSGTQLTVTLVNKGKMPNLQHNFVLLAPDMDPARFGNAAMSAQDDGYIPTSLRDSVIANTRMAASGQSVSTTFTVPGKGAYVYICSYPGHYTVSRGKLIAK